MASSWWSCFNFNFFFVRDSIFCFVLRSSMLLHDSAAVDHYFVDLRFPACAAISVFSQRLWVALARWRVRPVQTLCRLRNGKGSCLGVCRGGRGGGCCLCHVYDREFGCCCCCCCSCCWYCKRCEYLPVIPTPPPVFPSSCVVVLFFLPASKYRKNIIVSKVALFRMRSRPKDYISG